MISGMNTIASIKSSNGTLCNMYCLVSKKSLQVHTSKADGPEPHYREMITVEPLNNGHHWDELFCPLFGGVLYIEVHM